MTNLWGPIPLALLYDLRVRGLSWADRGVLHHLHLVASTSEDRQTIPLPQRPGETSLAAWRRALGDDGAEAVGRLVQAGLLETTPAGLRTALQTAAAPSRSAEAPNPQPRPATPASGPVERLRALFSKHNLKTADDRTAWLRTEHGRKTLDRLELTEAEALGVVARTGAAGGRFGSNRAAVTDGGNPPADGDNRNRRTAVTTAVTSLPSHTLPSERNAERKGENSARAAVTDGGNRNPPTAVTPDDNPAAVTDPFGALQELAAPVADLFGGGEVDASTLLIRMGVTGTEARAMAAALAKPSAWWPDRKSAPVRATLSALLGFRTEEGYEARALTALVAHVRAGAAKPAPSRPAEAPPPRLAPPSTPDPAKVAAARALLAPARAALAAATAPAPEVPCA